MGYSFTWILAHLSQSFTASLATSASNAATASFVTASGVYGPYGPSSVLSASNAVTASYVNLLAGPNVNINYYPYGIGISASAGSGTGTPGGPLNSIQFNSGGFFSGSSTFTFNTASNAVTLSGSLLVSGAISASLGPNTVGFYGTSSWSVSSSYAITASYALNAGSGGGTGDTIWERSTGLSSSVLIAPDKSTANGTGAVAFGSATTASGQHSLAHGQGTTAASESYFTHAEGVLTIAGNIGSHAEGYVTYAYGDYSHAEGYISVASGTGSHTEGTYTETFGNYSHAEGFNTYTGTSFTYIDAYTSGTYSTPVQLVVQDTFYNNDNANTLQVLPTDQWYNYFYNGYNAILNVTASGPSGIEYFTVNPYDFGTVYDDTFGSGYHYIVPSIFTPLIYTDHTSVSASVQLGPSYLFRRNGGLYAHSEGTSTKAIGTGSHAEGNQSYASGKYSHAEGDFTNAGLLAYSAQRLTGNGIELDFGYGDVTSKFGVGNTYYTANPSTPQNITKDVVVGRHFNGTNTIITGSTSYLGSPTPVLIASLFYPRDGEYGIGQKQHAEGAFTTAVGPYSHTEGAYTYALGNQSHAEGYYTFAYGDQSHTEGDTTQAVGLGSHAEGYNTIASESYSHAEGYYTYAYGNTSHGEGIGNLVYGSGSHVEGNKNSAGAPYGHVVTVYSEGANETYLTVPNNLINFYQTGVPYNFSGSLLYLNNTPAGGFNQINGEKLLYEQVGYWLSSIQTTLFTVKNATTDTVNTFITLSGVLNYPDPTFSFSKLTAFVIPSQPNILPGIGLGFDPWGLDDPYQPFEAASIEIGEYSHAEGGYNIVIGKMSHAEGFYNMVIGSYSHAEGTFNLALDIASHVEGYYSKALGSYSHAEGGFTIASASYAHAEGMYTTASGQGGHAEGFYTKAFGNYSHAEGSGSTTLGTASHAQGNNTIASGSYQAVLGQFNRQNNTTDLFVIGDGTSNTNRHDLLNASVGLIRISGSATISSSLTVVGTSTISGSNTITGSWFLIGNGQVTGSLLVSNSLVVTGSISVTDNVFFGTTDHTITVPGQLAWTTGDATLELGLSGSVGAVPTLKIGEQSIARVFNAQGTSITKGQVVYISGSQGNRIAVKLASATAELGSANTLGLVLDDISNGSEGYIITEGPLYKLNTNGLTAGSTLYLSTTPGSYTQTAPTPPNHRVILGFVERVDATVGSVYIKVDNGYEIDELHNVLITSPSSSGDLFILSGSVWTNSRQLTGSYSLTGSLTIIGGGLTGSLFGTSSWATSASYVAPGGPNQSIQFNDNNTVSGSSNFLFVKSANTVILTGSLFITGSAIVSGTFQVNSLASIQSQPAIQTNNEGVFMLGEYTTTSPVAVVGGIIYSGSDYYLGFNN